MSDWFILLNDIIEVKCLTRIQYPGLLLPKINVIMFGITKSNMGCALRLTGNRRKDNILILLF